MKPKEKIEAMRKYKRAKFLYNLILYSLTTLITFLSVSYPFWLPSTKHLFLVSLPNSLSHFFDAKYLFVLVNIIVFFLTGESKLTTRSSDMSTDSDIYDEYVVRSKSFRGVKSEIIGDDQGDGMKRSNIEEKRLGNDNKEDKTGKMMVCKVTGDQKVVKRMRRITAPSGLREDDVLQTPLPMASDTISGRPRSLEYLQVDGAKSYELIDMPMEELNKRVEAFIERVNKQRSLENY